MAKNTAAAIQFPERLMYSLGGPTPVAFGKAMTFDDRILYGCQPACPGLHWFPHGPVVLGVNTRPNDLESREASRREPQRSAWRRVRALTSGMVSGASWYAAPFVHLHSLIGHGVQGTRLGNVICQMQELVHHPWSTVRQPRDTPVRVLRHQRKGDEPGDHGLAHFPWDSVMILGEKSPRVTRHLSKRRPACHAPSQQARDETAEILPGMSGAHVMQPDQADSPLGRHDVCRMQCSMECGGRANWD